MQISPRCPIFISFRYIPRNEIAGSYGRFICIFFWIYTLFLSVIQQFTSPTKYKDSLFFTTFPKLVCCILDHRHSNSCEVIGISLWFWFAFPWWLVILHIFPYTCWVFEYIIWKVSIYLLCPSFNQIAFWLLSCMSSLNILNINPWCNMWFIKFFSHSVGCLFISLTVPLVVQKLFSLM